MPKLIVSEFLTLDGVMQAPGDPNEDRSGGFDKGGWQIAYFDDIFGKAMMDGFAAVGGFLLGRLTYDNFALTGQGSRQMTRSRQRSTTCPSTSSRALSPSPSHGRTRRSSRATCRPGSRPSRPAPARTSRSSAAASSSRL